MIQRVIDRTRLTKGIDDIVLCTSTIHQDLPLVKTAVGEGVYYFNGDPVDVLKRLLDAAKFFGMDYFISITADNPLFCFRHAGMLALLVRENPEVDFAYTAGMPIGLNTYALKVKALEVVCEIKKEIDTEIWGKLINRPEIFNVKELKAEDGLDKEYRLTLDEPDDYKLSQAIYEAFDPSHSPDISEVYDLFEQNPELASINSHVVQNALDDDAAKRIDKHYSDNLQSILALKERIYNSGNV